MDQTKTGKLLESARQVNARRQASSDVPSPSATQADITRLQWAGMLAAFFGIVSFPMFGWIGGLQTLAGALLIWVFSLIQAKAIAWQSSAEHFLQLIALRNEFAAYREKYGPSAEERRKAFIAAALTPS